MSIGAFRQHTVPAELHGNGRFVLSRRDFVPAYVKTHEDGRLKEKVDQALELLHSCKVCPRDCAVDRWQNQTGVCQIGRRARVASAFAHLGEENCLRGWRGSGTIFLSWCNLRCMPDFKLWDADHCARYLLARDYAEAARRAIRAMHEQVGELKVDEDGVALRGVLVRHLVMPGRLDDTREILRWLANGLSRDTYVNVMDQYRPAWKAHTEPRFADINRGLTKGEFERAMECAREAGLWRLDARWR